jgi:hypothetical protein
MEDLRRQNQEAQQFASQLGKTVAEKDALQRASEAELHRLRRLAAVEKEAAEKLRQERDEALVKENESSQREESLEVQLQNLRGRYELVCDELARTKQHLETEKQRVKYTPPSCANGGDDPAFLTAENFGLKSRIEELENVVRQKEIQVDLLSDTVQAVQQENRSLTASLRHEQQRNELTSAAVQSHKVLLDDASSEVHYLRLLVGEQKQQIDRMTAEHEHRFERLKVEMEAREVREIHAENVLQGAKSLHIEAAKVHKSLLIEQEINSTLRDEISKLRTALGEEQRQNKILCEKYEKLQQDLIVKEGAFLGHAERLESMVSAWQREQARQASSERTQVENAYSILKSMRGADARPRVFGTEGSLRVEPLLMNPIEALAPPPLTNPPKIAQVEGVSANSVGTSRPPAATQTTESSLEEDVKQLLHAEAKLRLEAQHSCQEALKIAASLHSSIEQAPPV